MTKVARSLSNDKYAAVNGANSPSASNVFATMDDLGAINVANLGNSDLVQSDKARSYLLNGSLSNDYLDYKSSAGNIILRLRGNNTFEFYRPNGDSILNSDVNGKTNISVGNVGLNGAAAQYAFNVYSRLASSSGIAKFFNSSGVQVFDFRQASGAGTLGINAASGVQQVYLNGSAGEVDVKTRYKVNGTNGFTGTGTYTNFTIEGGIITNAT